MKTTLLAVFTLLSSAAVSFALEGRSSHGHVHPASHNKAARHYGRDTKKIKRGGPSKTARCAAQASIASVSSVSVASVSAASVASVSSVSALSAWSAASVASVAATHTTPPPPAPTDDDSGNNDNNNNNSGSGSGNSGSGSGSGSGGDTYTGGDGTFYSTGLNACGTVDQDSDFIAAAAHGMFETFPGNNGNSNENPICGKMVTVHYQGKTVQVKITDLCAGCDIATSLDFSPSAFDVLADPSVGRIHGITWSFDDGSVNPNVQNP